MEIYDQHGVESFRGEDDTNIERWEAKEGTFEIYSKLAAEDWENFLFTDECPKYLFHYPNP